jgi:DNA-binding NarL/FixJ family response regulator
VEHATRFARRCSSGVNLFAVADSAASIREAVREAKPDIAVLVGTENAEAAARHAREVTDEAPSAVVLVLTPRPNAEVLDEVCHAAAMACVAATSDEHDPDSLAGEPAGTPPGTHVNGNGSGPGSASTRNGAGAHHIAPKEEWPVEKWPLTAREIEVLCAAAEGRSNAQIGRQLWVTEQTVKFHLSNIYRKLGVSNRTEAGRWAIARGLSSAPDSVPDAGRPRAAVMAR